MRFVVRDDLRRSRLTVAFRLILALVHLAVFSVWAPLMLALWPIHWLVALVLGRVPRPFHDAYELFVRFTLHLQAYLFVGANPFPGIGTAGSYPIDFPALSHGRQRRWSIAALLLLALLPLLLAAVLGGAFVVVVVTTPFGFVPPAIGAAVCAWFATLAKGRTPPGLRDLTVFCAGYGAQVTAYLFLLTDHFPDSDPKTVPLLPRPRHPVRMDNDDELRRHRLIVLFRFVLLLPHVVWLQLWSVAMAFAAVAAWVSGIALGRVPGPLHRFLAAYVRYQAHVIAFGTLAGGLFPGFVGAPGMYPLDVEIDPPQRQSRWTIGFRFVLAVPAFLILAGLGPVWYVGAAAMWVFALVKGRAPRGLHALLGYTIRYNAQVLAYTLLLTGRYPHSGPSEVESDVAFPLPPGAKPFELAPELPFHAPAPPPPEPLTAGALSASAADVGAAL